jgi:copper chaperone CopZ
VELEFMEKTIANSIASAFSLEGMTCQACVKTIADRVSAISDVTSVDVSLEGKRVDILANRVIALSEISNVITSLPKYTAHEFNTPIAVTPKPMPEVSLLKTYKPLITIFAFIFLVSLAYQISLGAFNAHLFMNHIMAGFFIGLSFFKFLDLKAFAESFSGYDPFAQRWLNYGYAYPFVELLLGLLFVAGKALVFANALTVIVLTVTTYGVYKRLQSKNQFQCACLGTTFSLPLSNVTIFENAVMIFMATYGILRV